MVHWVYCREQMRRRYRREFLTHLILPAVLRRHLRDQNPVCPASQGANQGQVARITHTQTEHCVYKQEMIRSSAYIV